MEQKHAKVLGKLKMVQDAEGKTKVQVSNEFLEQLSLHIMFLAMNVEFLSNLNEKTILKTLQKLSRSLCDKKKKKQLHFSFLLDTIILESKQ